MWPVLASAAVAALAACATPKRVAVPTDHVPLERRVDELVHAGCYRCLREALEILPAANAAFDQRRFEVLVLLAARVRELGLVTESAGSPARETPQAPSSIPIASC